MERKPKPNQTNQTYSAGQVHDPHVKLDDAGGLGGADELLLGVQAASVAARAMGLQHEGGELTRRER
jgi:hypothetical protein